MVVRYDVSAEFREIPSTDRELVNWLNSQPDVDGVSVQRQGRGIRVSWTNRGARHQDPVTPNIRSQFERFGYEGLGMYREQKQTYRLY